MKTTEELCKGMDQNIETILSNLSELVSQYQQLNETIDHNVQRDCVQSNLHTLMTLLDDISEDVTLTKQIVLHTGLNIR